MGLCFIAYGGGEERMLPRRQESRAGDGTTSATRESRWRDAGRHTPERGRRPYPLDLGSSRVSVNLPVASRTARSWRKSGLPHVLHTTSFSSFFKYSTTVAMTVA